MKNIEQLLALRVGDVMHCEVHTLSANQTLEEAAVALTYADLSGAPVVDERGHCVGMLCATDFVRELTQGAQIDDIVLPAPDPPLLQETPYQPLDIDAAVFQRVHRHMVADVQSVPSDTPVLAAARMMCDLHLHRLPVLDEKGHMLGMVCSLDLLAAMVRAIEE